jgi:hypothetical protein
VLTTDASNIAVAAILTPLDDDSRQHPVAYESRKLTAAERNYPAHVLELRNYPAHVLAEGIPALLARRRGTSTAGLLV